MALPAYQDKGTAQEGTGDITVPWPTHAVGDVALLFVESTGGNTAVLGTANGFVEITGSPVSTGTGTSGTRLTVFWCRATSTSMSSPVVTDPGNHAYGVIITYRNCVESGNPVHQQAEGVNASAGTSVTFPSVTTTQKNCLILLAVTSDVDSASAFCSVPSNANLSSITERQDAGTALGNGGALAVFDGGLVTAGSTGTSSATVTSSIGAFMTIALTGNDKPTISPNTADAHSFGADTTPTIEFTGTDEDSDDIRYEIQIDTANTFDTQSGTGAVRDTEVTANGNGVNSMNFGALTTAEDEEVLIATIHFSNTTPTGVTFSGGGLTWAQIGSVLTLPSSDGQVFHYYAVTSSALSAQVITATFTGGGFPQASGTIQAFKNIKASPIGNNGTGTADNVTAVAASVTTTEANALVIAGTGHTGSQTMSAGSGETADTQVQGGSFSRTAASRQNAVTASPSTSVQMDITIGSNGRMGMRAIEILSKKLPLLDKVSGTDSGFANTVTGGDSDPFNSGEKASFTVQGGDALSPGTYYWRARAKDPNGNNNWSGWTTTRSFTISAAAAIPNKINHTNQTVNRASRY